MSPKRSLIRGTVITKACEANIEIRESYRGTWKGKIRRMEKGGTIQLRSLAGSFFFVSE